MIYYPLSVLMLAGIREIAVITTPEDQDQFRRLLGDGSQWGMRFEYVAQAAARGPRPGLPPRRGVPRTAAASTMVLGDNIFYGHDLPEMLRRAGERPAGRHGLRLPGRRPRALRRRRLRRRGPGPLDRGEAGEAAVELRRHRHLRPRRQRARPRPRASSPAPAASSRSPSSSTPTSPRACSASSAWAAASPGSTPAPTPACSTPATSSAPSRSGRTSRSAAPRRSPSPKAGSRADDLRALAAPYLKTEYGQYLIRVADDA